MMNFDQKLTLFCQNHCPGLSAAEMFSYIQQGSQLEGELAKPNLSYQQLKRLASVNAAVHLMWLLTLQAAQQNKLHTQGCYRLDDPNCRIHRFLRLCGGDRVYVRTSTHMNENTAETGARWGKEMACQYGLDITQETGTRLPANMGTILFIMQPDETLYIKLEENGFKPFWQWQYCTLTNVVQAVNHLCDYHFPKSRQDQAWELGQFKEHLPRTIREEYCSVLFEIYPAECDYENKDKIFILAEEGMLYGVTRIYDILTKTLADYTFEKKTALQIKLFTRINEARTRGYRGHIKGKEVTLPRLKEVSLPLLP